MPKSHPPYSESFRADAVALVRHSGKSINQAAGETYQTALAAHGIRCWMSRRGNCLDNPMAESFFATLKPELMPVGGWTTKAGARAAAFEWSAVYYNRQRHHSSLDLSVRESASRSMYPSRRSRH